MSAPGGLAVFKFSSLQLTGDPMISTADGPDNLVLVGVDGITSGGPGGVLHFAGIDELLLATQNGSINLGPEISFDGPIMTLIFMRAAPTPFSTSHPTLPLHPGSDFTGAGRHTLTQRSNDE